MNLPLASILNPSALPSGGGDSDAFSTLFGHVVPHQGLLPILHQPTELFGLPIYNIQFFQILSILAIFLVFRTIAKDIQSNGGGRFSRVFAGWTNFIREEMVQPYLGEHHGRILLPLFLSIFFFIAFMNLFGLVPGGATATGSVWTNAALATVSFSCMVVGGMVVQGPIAFWKNLIPHGVMLPLIPLMFVVEIMGLVVKPIALTIRLFANMTGGHLVLLAFMGLIFYFGTNMGTAAGFAILPLGFGMSVFMMIIESFVALIQAYIFTLLSIIFVGMCLHPDH